MREQTVIDNATRCGQAYTRGLLRGQDDERLNVYNERPLSGEWAGESVLDLLGDLIDDATYEWEQDRDGDGSAQYFYDLAVFTGDITDELAEHYEQGYMAAFADRSFCDHCGGLIDATYGIADDSGLAWCGDDCYGLAH